ncbi:mycothiol transferase [Streptomyces asiaticus]
MPHRATDRHSARLKNKLGGCLTWHVSRAFCSRSGRRPWPGLGYNGSDLWATEDETRDQIIGFYRRTWGHSDATINELPLDAPGHVPWWPEPYPNTNLFAVMVHVLGESIRHAGHADILRERLDGRTGVRAEHETQIDEEARAAYCAKIEQAARSAAPLKA